ncbi:phenolic acid decarboxylase [Amycolatopsis sp. NPDC004368]
MTSENTGITGKHLLLRYDNGWFYEIYFKSETVIDYRVHESIVAGRWVKDQEITQRALPAGIHKVFWVEPTGTVVSLDLDLAHLRVHDAIFFPRWVELHPERTSRYQNEALETMTRYRDEGPVYPLHVVEEFADICFLAERGVGDEDVIACAPRDLPAGYVSDLVAGQFTLGR